MTPARTYKARGIVLRARNLGEADKIVTFFTLENGKIDAVAKGVRRTKSAFAGRLEFANECDLTMHRGRSLDVIATADIHRELWTKLVRPEAFAAAHQAIELIDAFCELDAPLPEVYALLAGVLAAIADADDPSALLPRFSLRLLDALGVAPPTDACVRCGQPLPEQAFVDGEAGGLIGAECRERWRELIELDEEDRANVRALAAPKGGTRRAALTARPRVVQAVELLVAHHLGRRPKAGAGATGFVTARR